MNKSIHRPITFIDKLVKKNELGQPFKLMDHQREDSCGAWRCHPSTSTAALP